MKKIALLLFSVAISALGCHPMAAYNARIDRIDTAYLQIRGNSEMSSYQKNQAFLTVLKSEFPAHLDKIAAIEADYNTVFAKRERGEDAAKDLDNANKKLADFLAFTKEEAYHAELKYLEGHSSKQQKLNSMRPLICPSNLSATTERTNCN